MELEVECPLDGNRLTFYYMGVDSTLRKYGCRFSKFKMGRSWPGGANISEGWLVAIR